MTIKVKIINQDQRLDTKERVKVIIELKSMVKPIYGLHATLKPGEETTTYVHPGQSVILQEFYDSSTEKE